jgi:glutamine synthetase
MGGDQTEVRAEPGLPGGLADADATRVRVETPDLNGALRGKYVAVEKLTKANAVAFPESYLAFSVADETLDVSIGQRRTGFPDLLVVPDWSTLYKDPNDPGVVAVVGDGITSDGRGHPLHPRSVLRSIVDRAAQHGYEGIFGVEYEFWVFRSTPGSDRARRLGNVDRLAPLSFTRQGYSLLRWADHAEFATELERTARTCGMPIETCMTEIGNGMLEVALAPAGALRAADRAARFKVLVRDVARRHDLFVTFMAKLFPSEQGSSGHLHQSLLSEGRNILWGGSQGTLSEAGLQYVAGLLQASRECACFFAPFPNSYRRYAPGMWVPLELSWGFDARTSTVRAITRSESTTRLELRRSGADLQPYLAIGACLAGGVNGILRSAEPGAPGEPAPDARFPTDLASAGAVLRDSEFAKAWFGEEFVDFYAESRLIEQRAWQTMMNTNIPPWEVRRYFEVV